VLASEAPLVVAPAMHTEMWLNAATQVNVATLRERGVLIVGPASGQLTGDDSGPGRMAEPDEIVRTALDALRPRDLDGMRVVISAGGTREPIDPVRYLGNRSGGRQGVALAEAARSRGADAVLVAAHLEVAAPAGVRVVEAGTAAALKEAMLAEQAGADVVIMAAAVADFRPVTAAAEKIKKTDDGGVPELTLERTDDVLAALSAARPSGQRLVGFAAETAADEAELVTLAAGKAARKGADLIVANRVGESLVFGQASTDVIIVNAAGSVVAKAAGDKLSVAHRILDALG